MPAKPFSLYKRPTTRKNKCIYYVQFRDENGKRLSAISTEQCMENLPSCMYRRGILAVITEVEQVREIVRHLVKIGAPQGFDPASLN